MDLAIKDRVALVTGSSKGIGKAIAYAMAAEGAKVAICARNQDRLLKTAKQIEDSTGTKILAVRTDLTNKDEIASMVNKIAENLGDISILVNNTGGPPPSLFQKTSQEEWAKAADSLLMSVINCCREALPYMKKQKWGRIINMTSFAAKQPAKSLILSNTFRAGILGLTKTLSNELAGYGILVNAVCPGWTLTKRVQDLAKEKAKKTKENIYKIVNDWANEIPLKRLAKPEEIASLVTFLASQKASYITGATIQVDGGLIQSLI